MFRNDILLHADTDITEFSEKLTELSQDFRKGVMHYFNDIRKKIGEQHNERITIVRTRHNEELDQLRKEYSKMEEKVAIRDHYLTKFKELTFRMADQIAFVRRMETEKAQLRNILRKWNLYCKEKKIKKRNLRLSRKHYENNERRKILHRWYAYTLRNRRETNELAWESRTQAAVSRIRNDFNTHLSSLQKELEETKDLLRKEQRDKVILQENLKKAMMRGVCAMNNKFLEIIKDANENAKFVEDFQIEQAENIEPNTTNVIYNQNGLAPFGTHPLYGKPQQSVPEEVTSNAFNHPLQDLGFVKPNHGILNTPITQDKSYDPNTYGSSSQGKPQVHVFRELPEKKKTTVRRQHPLPKSKKAV